MTSDLLTFVVLLVASAALDALVRPRRPGALRTVEGLWLLACMASATFGLFQMLCGHAMVALALALAVQALLAVASNAKHAMLGEPLLFSDLALVASVFRHPQFYLSAVRLWQRVIAVLLAAALLAVLVRLSRSDPGGHLAGLAVLGGALLVLALSLRFPAFRRLAAAPDAARDVARLGLLPVLLLYWLRWRRSSDPPPSPAVRRSAPADAPELVVIVQCESFADPAELFADAALALPGLSEARARAWQWGNLEVSGFGAYTMRTEYGVLFGREEEALGFRRYDPFLTATRDASYALPARLAGWRSLFIHPHDMRFYGRDRIMPAGGFADLIGEDGHAPPAPGEGRYVTDAAVAEAILAQARLADGPTLLYAVTIENHGPWAPGGGGDPADGYLRLVGKGDAMLADLQARLRRLGREALLVFFGDHRPSIPGVTDPGGGRHTPYVMLRIGRDGGIVPRTAGRVDLTPAALHHAVLDAVLGAPASDMERMD